MGREHNNKIDELAHRAELNPFERVVAADHTDDYPDPDPVNGHIPDLVTEDSWTGVQTLTEVESSTDQSSHAQEQAEAFGTKAEDPMFDFETKFYDDEDAGFSFL